MEPRSGAVSKNLLYKLLEGVAGVLNILVGVATSQNCVMHVNLLCPQTCIC